MGVFHASCGIRVLSAVKERAASGCGLSHQLSGAGLSVEERETMTRVSAPAQSRTIAQETRLTEKFHD